MSILSTLASILTSPALMKLESYFPKIMMILFTRQATFEIDGYSVSAKIRGTPAALTLSSAILSLENIQAGKTGVFTCGDVELDIVRAATPIPASA